MPALHGSPNCTSAGSYATSTLLNNTQPTLERPRHARSETPRRLRCCPASRPAASDRHSPGELSDADSVPVNRSTPREAEGCLVAALLHTISHSQWLARAWRLPE